MRERMWRSGLHSALLALTLALFGAAPMVALADDDLLGEAEAAQTHSGTVAEVFGKHFVLKLESGRRILVEVPRRDVILSPGERLEVTGSDEEGEFEALSLALWGSQALSALVVASVESCQLCVVGLAVGKPYMSC